MPGHHSQCVCMVLPRAAVRTQMPGHLSLSALSAANISIISIQTIKRAIFFHIPLKKPAGMETDRLFLE
nr:MAG TPA: hypothetical protein [Caudoviricetes sp.]DAU40727.1 MAG TPA: hypothetical protein [Caudoviricetes sp.]